MTRKEQLFWILFIAFVTLLIEYVVYGIVLFSPNSRMIMDNTDGRHIYFNIAYHLKYGHGLILSNQNYPYYESLFMTDAQATLAVILNFIHHHLFSIDNYVVGIVNVLVLYTIPLCSIFLFLIFKQLKIESILAFVFAILICFLSPQVIRITCGHFGISYLFYIPMLILFALKINEEKSNGLIISFLSIVSILLFGFNNGYMALIGAMFFLVFGLSSIIFKWKHKSWKTFLPLITALISIVLFFAIIKFYDKVTDRELMPYGFLDYYAQFESIFLPTQGKLFDFYSWLSPLKIAIPKEEGLAYVGFIGFLVLLFTVGRYVYFFIKRRWKKLIFPMLNTEMNILLLTATIIFLYAICFPFRFGLEFLIEDFSFVRQFRSTGRFAWIFYYIFSINVVYMLHLLIRKLRFKRYKLLPIFLVLFCIVAYTFDIQNMYNFDFRYINNQQYFPNIFDKEHSCLEFTKQYNIDTNTYSSIYGIPICNQWNAKFGREDEAYKTTTKLINLSYFTSLPMIIAKLSRVSTFQTMITAQFVSHPIIRRELFSVIDTTKKILIVLQNDYTLSESEQYVISHANRLSSDSLYSYYSFSPTHDFYNYADSIQNNFMENYASTNSFALQAIQNKNIVEAFYPNEEKVNVAISDSKENKLIYETDFKLLGKDSTIDFSIWSKVDIHTDGSPWILIERYTTKNELFDTKYLHVARALDYQMGMLKTEISYKMDYGTEHLKVYIFKGKGHVFERMLIKPHNLNRYKIESNRKYFDNYLIW